MSSKHDSYFAVFIEDDGTETTATTAIMSVDLKDKQVEVDFILHVDPVSDSDSGFVFGSAAADVDDPDAWITVCLGCALELRPELEDGLPLARLHGLAVLEH